MTDNIHFIILSVDLGSEKYLPIHELLSVIVRISKIFAKWGIVSQGLEN